MSLGRWLGLELAALSVLALGGAAVWLGCPTAGSCAQAATEQEAADTYSVLGSDLEPFRSEFNAARQHVRAVLLVGPT